MKKLFRHHRGSLAESLSTTIEVNGLADMQEKIQADWSWFPDYLSNIRIDTQLHEDDRLPAEWNGITFYVLADFADGGCGCIGMCNFYESEDGRYESEHGTTESEHGGTATPDAGE